MTISQIADRIGVSRQAIHKKIKQEPLLTGLQGHMSTVSTKGNAVDIDVDGVNMIVTAFGISVDTVDTVDVDTNMSTVSTNFPPKNDINEPTVNHTVNRVNRVNSVNQEQIDDLKEQIVVRDKRVEKLASVVQNMSNEIDRLKKRMEEQQRSMNAAFADIVAKLQRLKEDRTPIDIVVSKRK